MRHCWILLNSPLRSQVETFICERYWLSFNACLLQLPTLLLGVFEHDMEAGGEQLVAACGIQLADQQRLFSQVYLDALPQQYRVGERSLPVADQLAEVGSMAAVSADYLPHLFAAVIASLQPMGRTAVIFTATRALQKYFARQGIKLTRLADAQQAALPEPTRDLWGNYYRHKPIVLAGWLDQGMAFCRASEGNVLCQ